MSENLDFSIPSKKDYGKALPLKWIYIILVILVVLTLLNIILFLINTPAAKRNNSSIAPSAGAVKGLALKLEKQEINREAISAWKEYLAVAIPDVNETARVWYRIGKLSEAMGDYDSALHAYYRSETFANPNDIGNEINIRIQSSLGKAGRFASLRYELENRV
ncbi:MAG: hypothetical protein GX846_10830 [Deltaproteobacteria bacterium]|nr:hypothetical protein [Deltaproteobacteria bacterium]